MCVCKSGCTIGFHVVSWVFKFSRHCHHHRSVSVVVIISCGAVNIDIIVIAVFVTRILHYYLADLCAAERKTSLGRDWHPTCLRCSECGRVLSPGQHAEVLTTGQSLAKWRGNGGCGGGGIEKERNGGGGV